jgi:hypothetical protein
MSNESEKVFLSDQNVTISNARIILQGTTYSTLNVTSVSMYEGTEDWASEDLVYHTITWVLNIISIIIFYNKSGLAAAIIAGFIGMFVFYIVSAYYISSVREKYETPYYSVKIGNASGENEAMWSYDKSYIQKVVNAVNQALISQRDHSRIHMAETAATFEYDTKECPMCAETVKVKAKVCRFCNHPFVSS